VHNHKLAGRDFKAYNPYPQPQSHSPVSFRNRSLVVNPVVGEKHSQGVVKRGGATVKWLSPEQNMAKMEGMRRHEEHLNKAEKDRILQHIQIQHAPTHHTPKAERSQPTSFAPKMITIQGTKFQVSSGGNKLQRLSGMSTRRRVRPHPSLTQKSQTSLLWQWSRQGRSMSMAYLSSAPRMATCFVQMLSNKGRSRRITGCKPITSRAL
jgi:hypothetical protein